MVLLRTIPALPVADLRLALAGWTSGLGFRPAHVEAGFAVLRRDDAEVHLWEAGDVGWAEQADLAALATELGPAGVLHPSQPAVRVTGYGTGELHALDPDGNLVTFFRRR